MNTLPAALVIIGCMFVVTPTWAKGQPATTVRTIERVIRSKGLNPGAIRFKIDRSVSGGLRKGYAQLNMFYNKKQIGRMELAIDRYTHRGKVERHPYIEWVKINSRRQGKGLGTLFYLGAAKWAWSTQGKKVLHLTSNTYSDGAGKLWGRLVRGGIAERYKERPDFCSVQARDATHLRFSRHVLNGNTLADMGKYFGQADWPAPAAQRSRGVSPTGSSLVLP